ncbi:MAG: tetratricopeptide repeat protein, partial [Nitrospira sp.]|nr:tetratricopeptide repeat protein [Nitrospira sp.]
MMQDHIGRGFLVLTMTAVITSCAGSPGSVDQAESTQINENSASSIKTHAEEAFRNSRFEEAAQLFTSQAQVEKNNRHKAWFNAGASYWNAGQKTQALEAYEQAVVVNPLYRKGHIRLTNKYASLGRTELSNKHKQHAKAIQQVTKVMLPHWDKANQLRGRGADYDYAAATIHDACAQYYDEQGMPELAAAERKLAEQS